MEALIHNGEPTGWGIAAIVAGYLFCGWVVVFIGCLSQGAPDSSDIDESMLTTLCFVFWPFVVVIFSTFGLTRLLAWSFKPAEVIRTIAKYHKCNHCGETRNIGGWCSKCGQKIEAK